VQSLNSVYERRPIPLVQYVRTDLDHEIWPHADEIAIKRCMVKTTQRQTISYDWLSAWLRIRNDMGCIEKLLVSKTTKSALPMVGIQNSFAKRALMQPNTNRCSNVGASCGFYIRACLV